MALNYCSTIASARKTTTRHRPLVWVLAALPLLLSIIGCEQPKLDPQKYGKVLPDLPRISGVEKPYSLPQLEETTAASAPTPK